MPVFLVYVLLPWENLVPCRCCEFNNRCTLEPDSERTAKASWHLALQISLDFGVHDFRIESDKPPIFNQFQVKPGSSGWGAGCCKQTR